MIDVAPSKDTPMNGQDTDLAELAGSFIHEIKNHLSTLGLNLQLLAEDFEEPESQRERRALARIHKLQAQCGHLVHVSNDFLRFARIQDLERIPTDLGGLIDEMTDFVAPTAAVAGIEVKTYLPTDLPQVPLDRELFKQALLNLLLNAEQALPDGGEITLQAAVDYNGPEPQVVVHVIDNGNGMTPEIRARIFEPFFSTKETGNGLGLPTTKRIVEAHHGLLQVESEVGCGTRFTILLPVATADSLSGSSSVEFDSADSRH